VTAGASGRSDRPARSVDRGAARPGGSDLAAHRARLRAVIGPVVESAGYDLEDLTVSRAGRRHLLRIMVDGDGGVSLDEVADLSRDISAALDRAEESGGEFTAGEYVLEVGSPGVDRPLTLPRHWRRNIGRLVAVRADDRQLTGRITAADEQRVTVDVDGLEQHFGYGVLGPGRVQIEFGRLDGIGDDGVDDDELADFDEEREEDEE
jgi:ribosome maturation factor RimP